MTQPTILVDVDEVVADLLGVWLHRYNVRYSDTLAREDIVEWDLTLFVKPECGSNIFSFLGDYAIYDDVSPIAGALRGVKQLRKLGRVVFVSSANTATMAAKVHWLERWGLLEDDPRHSDLVYAHDKSLVRGDLLIDDGPHNVGAFSGDTILFDQYHNRNYSHPRRALNWDGVVHYAQQILGN